MLLAGKQIQASWGADNFGRGRWVLVFSVWSVGEARGCDDDDDDDERGVECAGCVAGQVVRVELGLTLFD